MTENDGSVYDEAYYIHGRKSGKSLYENYTWLSHLTVPMVKKIIAQLGIGQNDVVLDYGCARGYTVKAFRELGHEAYGVDISQWAIDNADEAVRNYVSCTDQIPPGMDWIIAKDVLEHVPQVDDVITQLMDAARIGVFVVVPLSPIDGQPYVIPDYELDVTHIHRLSLASWTALFVRHGWSVECRYRFRGVKDNYHGWLSWIKNQHDLWCHGNGFIIAKKV